MGIAVTAPQIPPHLNKQVIIGVKEFLIAEVAAFNLAVMPCSMRSYQIMGCYCSR